jgi:plasmid stabilization system protein ParE
MIRRLALDPDAERDLDAIFRYIAERNPSAADRYIHELRERCVFYAETPFIGQAEPSIARRLAYLLIKSAAFCIVTIVAIMLSQIRDPVPA